MLRQKLEQGFRAAIPYIPVAISVVCDVYTALNRERSSGAGSEPKTMRHGRSGGRIEVDQIHRMVKNTWKPPRKH